MAVNDYGGFPRHNELPGLGAGNPHPQYAAAVQGELLVHARSAGTTDTAGVGTTEATLFSVNLTVTPGRAYRIVARSIGYVSAAGDEGIIFIVEAGVGTVASCYLSPHQANRWNVWHAENFWYPNAASRTLDFRYVRGAGSGTFSLVRTARSDQSPTLGVVDVGDAVTAIQSI